LYGRGTPVTAHQIYNDTLIVTYLSTMTKVCLREREREREREGAREKEGGSEVERESNAVEPIRNMHYSQGQILVLTCR